MWVIGTSSDKKSNSPITNPKINTPPGNPSRNKTIENDKNTNNDPASGCMAISIIGRRIIAPIVNNVLILLTLTL